MSHFMSEKEHYQENADSVEEMLSNFTNSNGSTGEIKNGLILPQGSGTLRQQLLMMHGIAWYCKV